MSVTVTSLASGSSGNALLVQLDDAALLVDCGLPQRTIERQLRHVGIEPTGISAILLTHEHGDHACSAGPLARRWNLPVICNAPTRVAMGEQLDRVMVQELEVGDATQIGPFYVTSFLLAHDAAAPVGYLIEGAGYRVGVAVDLGSWDDLVITALRPADLLVVEANYDRERLRVAPYPWGLRTRIMGPRGHLDNVQAGQLLAQVGADGRTRDVWLAHLSERANHSPKDVIRVVETVLHMAGVETLRLAALPRRHPMRWSSDRMLEQGVLFDD